MAETKEAKAKAEAAAEETEEVFIPRIGKDDDALFVSVNGRRILIKKGVKVNVPKAHAEVIKHSFEQTRKNEEYIAAVSKE